MSYTKMLYKLIRNSSTNSCLCAYCRLVADSALWVPNCNLFSCHISSFNGCGQYTSDKWHHPLKIELIYAESATVFQTRWNCLMFPVGSALFVFSSFFVLFSLRLPWWPGCSFRRELIHWLILLCQKRRRNCLMLTGNVQTANSYWRLIKDALNFNWNLFLLFLFAFESKHRKKNKQNYFSLFLASVVE
jgi:hypothetical protein